jgi:imidazolonepropionase-like amidohydrolase
MEPTARDTAVEHRRLHDDINELLAALNRGVNAHILTNTHVDHAEAADTAAQLGAMFLHHAFVHGHVDTTPIPDDPTGPAGRTSRTGRALGGGRR